MNARWLLLRRLRGPAYLLTFGVTALLHQWRVLSFGQSWPLYLIVGGVLALLERAALSATPIELYPAPGYSSQGQPYPQGWSQTSGTPSTSIVPSAPSEITPEGRP